MSLKFEFVNLKSESYFIQIDTADSNITSNLNPVDELNIK